VRPRPRNPHQGQKDQEQPLPPPAARIATRQRKKIESLLVLASAADSAVKWV